MRGLFSALLFLAAIYCQYCPSYAAPVPDTVSDRAKALIGTPLNPLWKEYPLTEKDWKKTREQFAANAGQGIRPLANELNVSIKSEKMADVPVFVLTPAEISPRNARCVLLYIHGGAYTLNGGERGLAEAILMSWFGKFRIVSVDYRLAPEHPYPAALDDVLAVYRKLLETYRPDQIGVFGTSTGGALVLSLALAAKKENLPLPGAIAPGTPWSDLDKIGDSYFTNENLDNVLGAYDGLLKASALAYAGKHDLKDPLLSPVYGDYANFPPTMLTTGTRDLFLSNTARVHKRLLENNVPALMLVLEGLPMPSIILTPKPRKQLFILMNCVNFLINILRNEQFSGLISHNCQACQ